MKMKTLFAIAALAGSCFCAAAAPVLLTPSPTTPGTFTGSFTQSVDGFFLDEFSFLPSTFSGLVSVTLTVLSGPITFFTGSLNGQDFGTDPLPSPTFSFQALVSNDVPLSLTVFGAVLDADLNPAGAGSYLGTVTGVAAVPEPATFALILAGLMGVGLTRRRSSSTA